MKWNSKILKGLLALGVVFALASPLHASEDFSKLPKKKQTTLGLYMTSTDAYNYTLKNMDKTLFVDIRTPSEVNYLGAVTVMDKLVPWVFMDPTGWNAKKHRYKRRTNKTFVADMNAALKAKGLTKSDTIILICRSGDRSAAAVNLLAKNGYTKAYTVVHGYEGDKAKTGPNKGKRVVNGWKNSKMPWTYSLDGDLMYYSK